MSVPELPWIQSMPHTLPPGHPDLDDPASDLDAIRTILHAITHTRTSIYGSLVEEYGELRAWPNDRAAHLLKAWKESAHVVS